MHLQTLSFCSDSCTVLQKQPTATTTDISDRKFGGHLSIGKILGNVRGVGKQEFRRKDFGSRFLAVEGEGRGGSEGEGGEDGVDEGEGCVWTEAISFW